MDPRLAAQGITHLVAMGEGPIQVIRPSGMAGDDEWRQAPASQPALQIRQGAPGQFVIHGKDIDEAIAAIGPEP